MSVALRLHRYSFKDYLAVEEVSAVKHEFLDGEIYAMAGGSVSHAGLSAAMVVALHAGLGGRCKVYSSDLRIRVAATGLASYPDVTVVCGPIETDPESKDTVVNPTAVVEVLSPSTIDYDLGEKLEHYRKIPSLRAVVHVWQDQRRLQIHDRADDGGWRAATFTGRDAADIPALGCRLDLAAIYADVDLPA
jgi:Uma2 family endonuclease